MKYIFVIILLMMSPVVWTSNNVIETDAYIISYSPEVPILSDDITLKITNKDPCIVSVFSGSERGIVAGADLDEFDLFINFYVAGRETGKRDGNGNCLSSDLQERTFRLRAGSWDFTPSGRISIFTQGYRNDNNEEAEASFNIQNPYNSQFNAEAPAMGSIQSGIGMIRGWACDTRRVEIAFDGGERIPVSYGNSRGDTVGMCGDTNNGYGMVFAWGLLGKGTHQMKTFLDHAERSSVTFEVAGLDDPFVTGLSGTYELEGFPAPGESVTVEWSESDQNFIIIDKQ